MSETADAPLPDAVAALVEVASCDAGPARGDAALAALAEGSRRAAGAQIAMAWAVEAVADGGRAIGAAGLAEDDLARLAPLVAGIAGATAETEITPGGDSGPLADALAALGAPAALVIPLMGERGPGGVLLLAGPRAPGADPVGRAAARLGARRMAEHLDAVRLRANLERAMAQILEQDERMLGRMGLDIHDGPTQQLSVALLEVQLLEADLDEADEAGTPPPDSLRPSLARVYETVGGALHEMRELIGHLRPTQFEDRRLTDILQEAIDGFASRGDSRVQATWEGEFPVNGVTATQRITLYRILQEALTNAHRHGHASLVTVMCRDEEAGTTLVVTDDGAGFEPDAVQRRRPGMPLQRFGLHGMRDRAQMLGGTFAVDSAPGRGATVRVFLPRWEGAPPEIAAAIDAG